MVSRKKYYVRYRYANDEIMERKRWFHTQRLTLQEANLYIEERILSRYGAFTYAFLDLMTVDNKRNIVQIARYIPSRTVAGAAARDS